MNKSEAKEHFERCAAFVSLALFNRILESDYWSIVRPSKPGQDYDFDVLDSKGMIVGAIEVKGIVEPTLDRQSALGKIIEEVATSLSGAVPGQFQLLHVALDRVPTTRSERAELVKALRERVLQEANCLVAGQWKLLDEPVPFILRKNADQPSEIQPLFGFTAGSEPLDKQFYLQLIQEVTKKADHQLSASPAKQRILVFDSRTPITRILGTGLLVEALTQLPKEDYQSIEKVFLVEWPSGKAEKLAGVVVQGFPL